jgi:hypothetical protein
VSSRNQIVLCTNVLGGAEIFTLERMLQRDPGDVVLHCNSELTRMIKKDERYSKIQVVSEACLDGLASHITAANIASGVGGLRSILEKGGALLGNLRAAAMMLHPAVARRNDAFIHDNSHYLNLKTRTLIALIVVRSVKTFFPCHHSTLRLPFHRLLSPRIVIDYFGSFRPLTDTRRPRPELLKMAVVGRIEPAKNQRLALDIANRLAGDGTRVHLTLVGSRSDAAYCSDLMAAARHPDLELTQQEAPRSDIPSLLQKQDMIVHTSIAESLPLVLFEANSLGVSFFALPVGGIPEVLPKKYWLDVDIEESVRQIGNTLYSA